MVERRARRYGAWALFASLLLHGAVLSWLALRPPPPPVVPLAVPIELELLTELVPPVKELEPVALPSPSPAAVAAPSPTPPPTPRAAVEQQPELPQPEQAQSAGQLNPAAALEAAQPKLLPTEKSVVLPEHAEPAHGLTLHPEDIDAGALAAAANERGRKVVQAFAESELATARVQKGLLPQYFTSMRRELNEWAQHPPEVLSGSTNKERVGQWASELFSSYQRGAERYGAGVALYQTPDAWRGDQPSQMESLASNGDRMAMEGRRVLQSGARLREFGEGRLGTDLFVVVELRQAPDGSLVSSELLRSSGVKTFDNWVLMTSGNVVEHFDMAPPDGGLGVHPDGMRTVWGFTGRVSYLRKTKDTRLLEDAWYVLATLPATISGTFDEVTGESSYVDLRYPHYECKVQLLQLY